MNTYISLITFNEKALQNIKNSPSRAEEFERQAEAAGASVQQIYWTTGACDGVLIFQAEDTAAATALMLGLSSQGFVKTETMQAFDRSAFEAVLGRLG